MARTTKKSVLGFLHAVHALATSQFGEVASIPHKQGIVKVVNAVADDLALHPRVYEMLLVVLLYAAGLRFTLWWGYLALDVLVKAMLGEAHEKVLEATIPIRTSSPMVVFLALFLFTNLADYALRYLGCPWLPVGAFDLFSMVMEGVQSWFCWTRIKTWLWSARSEDDGFNIIEVLVEGILWEMVPATFLSFVLLPDEGQFANLYPGVRPALDFDMKLGIASTAALIVFLQVNIETPVAVQRAVSQDLESLMQSLIQNANASGVTSGAAQAAKLLEPYLGTNGMLGAWHALTLLSKWKLSRVVGWLFWLANLALAGYLVWLKVVAGTTGWLSGKGLVPQWATRAASRPDDMTGEEMPVAMLVGFGCTALSFFSVAFTGVARCFKVKVTILPWAVVQVTLVGIFVLLLGYPRVVTATWSSIGGAAARSWALVLKHGAMLVLLAAAMLCMTIAGWWGFHATVALASLAAIEIVELVNMATCCCIRRRGEAWVPAWAWDGIVMGAALEVPDDHILATCNRRNLARQGFFGMALRTLAMVVFLGASAISLVSIVFWVLTMQDVPWSEAGMLALSHILGMELAELQPL